MHVTRQTFYFNLLAFSRPLPFLHTFLHTPPHTRSHKLYNYLRNCLLRRAAKLALTFSIYTSATNILARTHHIIKSWPPNTHTHTLVLARTYIGQWTIVGSYVMFKKCIYTQTCITYTQLFMQHDIRVLFCILFLFLVHILICIFVYMILAYCIYVYVYIVKHIYVKSAATTITLYTTHSQFTGAAALLLTTTTTTISIPFISL